MKFLACLLPLALATPAMADPSFDCAAAATVVEKTICADQNHDLALRDSVLSTMYDTLDEAGGHDGVLAGQDAWLKARDACAADVACLRQRYDERLAELARAGGDDRGITGNYSYKYGTNTDFGNGYFVREADNTLAGFISTVSGGAQHSCEISFDGANPIGDAFVWDDPNAPADAEDFCRLLLRPQPGSIRVDSDSCASYCGAHASFDQVYMKAK